MRRLLFSTALLVAGAITPAPRRQELQAVLAERAPTERPRWTLKEVPRARQMLDSIRDRK